MKYYFKMETLEEGLVELEFETLKEAKKAYDKAINGSLGINKTVFGLSRIYVKQKKKD